MPRIALRMKQVNFKARLHHLINRLVNRAAAGVRGLRFTFGLLTAQPRACAGLALHVVFLFFF